MILQFELQEKLLKRIFQLFEVIRNLVDNATEIAEPTLRFHRKRHTLLENTPTFLLQ